MSQGRKFLGKITASRPRKTWLGRTVFKEQISLLVQEVGVGMFMWRDVPKESWGQISGMKKPGANNVLSHDMV
jgi:hypothetical protein